MEKKINVLRLPILPSKTQLFSCPFIKMETQIKKNTCSPRKEKTEEKIQVKNPDSSKFCPFSFQNFDHHFRKTLPDFENRRKSRSPEIQRDEENKKLNRLFFLQERNRRRSRSPEPTYEQGKDMLTDFINSQKIEKVFKFFAIKLMNQPMFKNLVNKRNGNKFRSFEFLFMDEG